MSTIILDEQDPSVTFNGNWDHLADPILFKKVATGSQTTGTSCSLEFTGSSITVVTTIRRDGPFSLQFSLDGISTTNTTTGFTQFAGEQYSYHDATFFADNLSDGPHRLTITSLQTTDTINVYLDYFLITASSQTNMTDVNVFVDDRDSSLQYSGNWRLDTADSDFRHTSRAADNTSNASLTIPFTGSGIQYYGLINKGNVGDMLQAQFILDATSTTTYIPTSQTADITYNNLLFDSGPLNPGPHTLVVTPQNEHLVWIDYLLVHQSGQTATSVSSLATSAPTSSATTPPITSSSTSSKAPVGAIVGGVVGGLVLLGGLLLFLLFLRRRRRFAAGTPDTPPMLTPYSHTPVFPTQSFYSAYNGPSSDGHSLASPRSVTTSAFDNQSHNPDYRKLPPVPSASSQTPAVNHVDSGVRIRDEFPPVYTAE